MGADRAGKRKVSLVMMRFRVRRFVIATSRLLLSVTGRPFARRRRRRRRVTAISHARGRTGHPTYLLRCSMRRVPWVRRVTSVA
jgi:hypothetical protein